MVLGIFLLVVFCFSILALIGCILQHKKEGIKLWSVVAVLSFIFNLANMNFLSLIFGIVFGILAYLLFISSHRESQHSEFLRTGKQVIMAICIVFAIAGLWGGFVGNQTNSHIQNENTDSRSMTDYQQLGQKLNKKQVKPENDNAYYVDKDDNKARYFTNENDIITAIKYNYMPDPMNTTSVQGKLKELLNDDNLKYGNDKVNEDDTTLDEDNYNVYSPKQKKWYHISMQKNDDDKVSTFSVWQGKDSDAE